jgi:hypothetical protein
MCVELMLLAVNINLVAFSVYQGNVVGQVFAMLVLTVAAAEAAIGLAILVVYFRNPRHRRSRRHQRDEGLRQGRLMDLAIKLIVLLPMVAAAIAGLLCRVIGDRPAQIVTCAALLIAAALSVFVFVRIGSAPRRSWSSSSSRGSIRAASTSTGRCASTR